MGFQSFQNQLIKNYILGSIIAVCGVGSIFLLSTLKLDQSDMAFLLGVLFTSLIIMLIIESYVFQKDLAPIRKAFASQASLHDLHMAFTRLHSFPSLAFRRILIPHFLGLSIPSSLMTAYLIHFGYVTLPYYDLIIAWVGAILIASMHGMIEFFLTTRAIKPIIYSVKTKAKEVYQANLTLNQAIIVSIRKKFITSALFISIFPIILFSLAVQVHFSQDYHIIIGGYWRWASIILLIAGMFAVFGTFLLTKDLQEPIEQLEAGMNAVQRGDFTEINNFYSDEFSRLITGFNHMGHAIKEREEMNNQLLESFFTVFAATLDARDPYTAGHSIRVANYATEIGKGLGLSNEEIDQLKKSALLHDIGKIGIKDEVLQKNGKLTQDEFEEIKRHPVIGAKILGEIQPIDAMAKLLPGVKYHHERYDGKGYPDGLMGDNIPMFGRILAVADAFDAMTSDRPYRKGMPVFKAIDIIKEGSGSQWDPYYAQLFINWVSENQEMTKALSS